MFADTPKPGLAERPLGRFLGRAAFQQVVRDALACAAQEGWREIVLSDPNFEDWPLGERAVCAALHLWARPGRQISILAHSFDEIVRRHARFVQWRTTWSHLVECRANRRVDVSEFPSAMCAPAWVMHRSALENCAGQCSEDAQKRILLRQSVDASWRQGSPAFPSTILGL